MRNKLFLFIIASLMFGFHLDLSSDLSAFSQGQKQVKSIELKTEKIKNKLSTIISVPFDVELNDNNVTLTIHKLESKDENILRNKLFSMASLLAKSNLAPAVIISIWKNVDDNFSYKAAVIKDDVVRFNRGRMSFDDLLAKMKVVKSDIENEQDSVTKAVTEEEPEIPGKLTLSSQKNLSTETESKPDLRPRIPPEKFYTPILKPIIRDDFSVVVDNSFVTVNVQARPSSDDNQLRDNAFRIFNQIMRVNPSLDKININWQNETGAYGKTASLAGIYVKDFIRNKMSAGELKEVIFISSIDPTSRRLNDVCPAPKVDVPIENLRKAKELREAATVYFNDKKLDSAIRTYKQAVKFNPNDFLSYYWMGEAYILKDSYKEAKEALTKSVSLNPEFRKADEILAKIRDK